MLTATGFQRRPTSCRSGRALFGEILLRVVDDSIRADGANHLHISRAANAGHICAEGFGDLHCEGAHTSGGAVDQDLLAGLYLSLVAKALQCGEGRDRQGASSNVTLCGLMANDDSGAHAYSA